MKKARKCIKCGCWESKFNEFVIKGNICRTCSTEQSSLHIIKSNNLKYKITEAEKEQIYSLLSDTEYITVKDIENVLNMSYNHIKNYLSNLRREGSIYYNSGSHGYSLQKIKKTIKEVKQKPIELNWWIKK